MCTRGVSASNRSRRSRRKNPYRHSSAPAPATAAITAGYCTWVTMCGGVRRAAAAASAGSSAREGGLQVDVRFLVRLEVQQLGLGEAAEPGDQHSREGGDAYVVGVDRVVVHLAPVGDRGLESADAILQVAERLVRLELGVVLGDRVQPREPGPQLALRGSHG